MDDKKEGRGSKRPRSEDATDGANFGIKSIKTEVDDVAHDDYGDPPTPPVPRANPPVDCKVKVEPQEDDKLPCSSTDTACAGSSRDLNRGGKEAEETSSKQTEDFSRKQAEEASSKQAEGASRKQVEDASRKQAEEASGNLEPVPSSSKAAFTIQIRPKEELLSDESPPPNGPDFGKPGDTSAVPSICNFFDYAVGEQVEATVPNAMIPETKHESVPVTAPQRARYHNHTQEEQFQYGDGRDGNAQTIPLNSKKPQQSDDEGSDDKEDIKGENQGIKVQLHHITRYFKRSSVYTKFDFNSRRVDTTRLAVTEKKQQILHAIEKGRVVIVEGFTGCGKTTQIPQYVLDKCREDQINCNIVVTQPRKIAAMSVTKRVCYERNWNIGSVVGYQVGMENKTSKTDTLVTFMTTGVLLQKLISQKSMKEFTHIFIDEVHERDLESDFLLLVIKKLMATDKDGKEAHVKLILMSATIETKKFENYFVFETPEGEQLRPHVVKIPFVARHRIEEHYLDDLLRGKHDLLHSLEINFDKERGTIQEEMYDVAVSCVVELDKLEHVPNVDPRLRGNPNDYEYPKHRGAVLVFLPGMEEIKKLQSALERAKRKKAEELGEARRRDPNPFKWVILPLHSSVTAEEQGRVFDSPGDRYRKIILSTNIAESSVTVPDISYVVDFCLTKSLCVDSSTNFSTLQMVWAAKSQCVQRKGRCGRVADGKVYRLLSRNFYFGLENEIIPEMTRSSLETVILMCKKFGLGSPTEMLSMALDKPQLSNIERAVSTLKELGAFTVTMTDPRTGFQKYDTVDGDLTFLGRVMTDLPISQACTKLIMFGHCFGVMQEAIIIAAALSVKSPFQSGFQRQQDTYLEKMKQAKKSFSDLFALYHVYKFWLMNYSDTSKKGNWAYKWAKGAMVQLPVLREIKATVELLEERLRRLGITDSYSLQVDPNANPIELTSEQGMFLKIAIAGAFYPNYFLRKRPDLRQFEREISKDLHGCDPFRSVYFRGFPHDNQGKLYAKCVADHLANGLSVPAIRFEGQKAMAVFDNTTGDTVGPFNTAIFRSIKLRQLRSNLEFSVLWKEDERRELARQDSIRQRRPINRCPELRELPPIIVSRVQVKIQHAISPSQFWVTMSQDFSKVEEIFKLIQDRMEKGYLLPQSKTCVNCLCLAPFEGCYYRAKILRSDHPNTPNAKSLVYFIDYGNSSWVSSSCLHDIPPGLVNSLVTTYPAMAVECRLSCVKPNIVLGLHWSEEGISTMKKFRDHAEILEFKIFSIVKSIMIGELMGYAKGRTQECCLNNFLMRKIDGKVSPAEKAIEPFLSLDNNRTRRRSDYMDNDEVNAASREQLGEPLNLDFYDPPRGRTPVTLKGPYSPLEMTFHALIHCSNMKEVKVENSSVNSVLLDHEPTTSTSRLLVAAVATVAQRSQVVMVRESTLMPAIPGILSLVAMIFAPRVELRVDKNQTKYTGVLCGCGTVPDRRNPKEAVHPDNDMEIAFDTEIDDDDIAQVNKIRLYLSLILRQCRGVNKAEYHKNLRNELIRLLRKTRIKSDEEVWPPEEYCWKSISDEFLQRDIHFSMFQHQDIFQPHSRVKLNVMPTQKEETWEFGY